MKQDNHAAKMIKLDGSVSSSLTKKLQYQQTHYGGSATVAAAATGGSFGDGHPRARSIQQIRYQHQPIRLSSGGSSSGSSKELKENYSDDILNCVEKRGGIKDGHNQHLVKTVSDLPVFVTIEDFRVASYTIGGEPHLCLPQLLQFLRQHFETKTMVEKFEESLIHFPSASPKQVEGFIKSSCLPPSAKSCPLIKRSDADKICLSLFEELSNAAETKPPSDIVSLCSKQQQPLQQQQQYKNQEKHSDIPSKNNNIEEEGLNCSIGSSEGAKTPTKEPRLSVKDSPTVIISSIQNNSDRTKSASKAQSPEINVQQEKINSVVATDYSDDDKYATVKKKLKCNNDETDATKSDYSTKHDAGQDISRDDDKIVQIDLNRDKISPTSIGSDSEAKQKAQMVEVEPKTGAISSSGASEVATMRDNLFETEAQSSILNFARAVTSTLMIRVYHKCFGKCIGLFLPSLLKSKQLESIQCTTCKVMLTPRRFVGHTHGSKENDVCHWGFNSYNWRSYIRLSKKQPMNNLDEDELLNQFNTLITSADDQPDRSHSSAASTSQSDPGHSYIVTKPSVTGEQNQLHQSKSFMDSPIRMARSSRRYQASESSNPSVSSGESTPQPLTLTNSTQMGNNTSISMMRRFSTTDESLRTPSTTILSAAPKLNYTIPQYTSRHASVIEDGGSMRLARSSSLSGRAASSACYGGSGGSGMVVPPAPPTRLTPQHSMDHFSLTTGTMNPYPVPPTASSIGSGLFSPPDQLTGDLRDFILQNWSASSTGSHPHPSPQPPLAAQLSMLPLAPPVGLPVTAGHTCNPFPPVEVARPARSQNEDLTKHLSLSAESKRELYVCTNLTTYLSRRGLSAGMTGDIAEKVLNLMRESRLML